MVDRRLGAISDAPLRLLFEQGRDTVVNHRVVGPAPLDAGMAPEEATDVRVGRLDRAALMAQQVDDQHIRLGHQGPKRLPGLRLEPFIGIEHQHPVPLHHRERLVAGRGEVPGPFDLLDPGAGGFGEGHGVVLGAGVDDHHLVDKALSGLQAVFDLPGFIPNDHREAEHGGCRRPRKTARG